MVFERYYASGLGRFRLSATTAAKPPDARDMPNDLERSEERRVGKEC